MTDESEEIKTKGDNFPWYKRDARAFYEGTRLLALEARGAYCDIIDLIFIKGGPIPDNERWMCHALHISHRKWRNVRQTLIDANKIQIIDGEIVNLRANQELEKRARSRADRGMKPRSSVDDIDINDGSSTDDIAENSEKPNENNETDQQVTLHAGELELEKKRREKIERKKIEKNDRSILSIEDLVEDIWLATSGRMIDDHDDPTALVKAWRRDGATDEDITETVRAVAANKREESIDHFGYFNQAVRDGMADRKAGQPNRHVPPREETQAEYLARRIAEDRAQDLAEAETHGTA